MDPADRSAIPWSDPDPRRPVPLRAALRQDLAAYVALGRDDGRARGRAAAALGSPGFHVQVLYRVAHLARHGGGVPGRFVAGLLFWLTRHAYFCSIASTARLHGGLVLPNPQGIVIGGGSEVGPGGVIEQNVTLGGSSGKAGMPRVGAGARLGCGAVLVGPVAVGDGVEVGPYAVVWIDVPARSAVLAPPPELRPRKAPGEVAGQGAHIAGNP